MAKGSSRFDRWRRPGEDTEVIPAVKDDDEVDEVTGEIPVAHDDVDDYDADPESDVGSIRAADLEEIFFELYGDAACAVP